MPIKILLASLLFLPSFLFEFKKDDADSTRVENVMIHLTPSLVEFMTMFILTTLLMVAAWNDIKFYRIPNKLVAIGICIGLFANSALPEGNGLISELPGSLGFLPSIAGLATGLIILMPLYTLRGMGAGDVKLIAMIGSFMGVTPVLAIILLTFIIGGMLAIFVSLYNRSLGQVLTNLWTMIITGHFKLALRETPTFDSPVVSAGKLPYAIPIALGTFTYILIVIMHPDFMISFK